MTKRRLVPWLGWLAPFLVFGCAASPPSGDPGTGGRGGPVTPNPFTARDAADLFAWDHVPVFELSMP
ncbi:MAG: hypothetical protein ABUS79_11980 [Pseudomonadota bacterium]